MQPQSRQQYFLQLTAKLGLRPNHHNVGDLIRNCRSAEYHGEATLLERLLAQNGEANESTFIQPFIASCTEEQLTPDHVKKSKNFLPPVSDEYARLPAGPPNPHVVCDVCKEPVNGPIKCMVCRYKQRNAALHDPGFSFYQLTEEHTRWIQHNFPEQLIDPARAEDGFDGLVEEVGELARARLKKRQGIRGTAEEWDAQIRDSCGDIVIFLNSWCIAHGINLGECVETAWKEVRERDWKKYPKTGVPPKDDRHVLEPGDLVHTPMGPGRVISAAELQKERLCLVRV